MRFSSPLADAPIPALDPRDEEPCLDPGISGQAIRDIAETRLALADCAARKDNVVEQYNSVRGEFGRAGDV